MIECNLGNYEKLILLDAIKIYFLRFLALSFTFNINTLIQIVALL